MTAAELLRTLDGVPDEALPMDIRIMLSNGDEMSPVGYDVHAAVGAMVAWLVGKQAAPLTQLTTKGYRVNLSGVRPFDWFAPSLLEALASACSAANKNGRTTT